MKLSLVVGKKIQQAKKFPMNAPGRGTAGTTRILGKACEHTHEHRLCKEYQGPREGSEERYRRVQLCTVNFMVPLEYSRLYEECVVQVDKSCSFGNHRSRSPPLETDRGVEDRQVEQSDFVAKEPAPRALLEHTRSALAARRFFAARFLGVFVNKTGSQPNRLVWVDGAHSERLSRPQ